jgi:hypothetical protein
MKAGRGSKMARIHIGDLPEKFEFDEKEMRRILGGHEILSGSILRYLSRNPAAEDTLEGITNWWTSVNINPIKPRRCDHDPN